MCSEIRPQIA